MDQLSPAQKQHLQQGLANSAHLDLQSKLDTISAGTISRFMAVTLNSMLRWHYSLCGETMMKSSMQKVLFTLSNVR